MAGLTVDAPVYAKATTGTITVTNSETGIEQSPVSIPVNLAGAAEIRAPLFPSVIDDYIDVNFVNTSGAAEILSVHGYIRQTGNTNKVALPFWIDPNSPRRINFRQTFAGGGDVFIFVKWGVVV